MHIARWFNICVCCLFSYGVVIGCSKRPDAERETLVAGNGKRTDELPSRTAESFECSDPVDPEKRTEKLGDPANDELLDLTALEGMPDQYRQAFSAYVSAVIDTLGAPRLSRKHYYCNQTAAAHEPSSGKSYFPDIATAIEDREMIVSIVLLPRPETVNHWIQSRQAQAVGYNSMSDALQQNFCYGRCLIFAPGDLSENPDGLPACPLGTSIPYPLDYAPIQSADEPLFFIATKKLVCRPLWMAGSTSYETRYDGAQPLKIGEKGGATRLAELRSAPVLPGNGRLRWVQTDTTTEHRRFLAYAMIDGNGAKRSKTYRKHAGGFVSPYLRPLICSQHQPRVLHHDLLLVPTPMSWPARARDSRLTDPHEEWCLDDWFPTQKEACWVFREAEDSKPLQESFLLMPADQPSNRPIFSVAVFAETEPSRLVRELAALHGVSSDPVLSSKTKMAQLQTLYQQLLNVTGRIDVVVLAELKV